MILFRANRFPCLERPARSAGPANVVALALVALVATSGCADESTAVANDGALRTSREPASNDANRANGADRETTPEPNFVCGGADARPSREAAERLAAAFGTWRFDHRESGGAVQPVERCDRMMAYTIGLDDGVSPAEAASCALVRSEVIPLRAARIAADGCPMVRCGGFFGLVWYETNGSVFELDAEGNVTGAPLLTLDAERDEGGSFHLIQTNSGLGPTETRIVLARTNEEPTCAP